MVEEGAEEGRGGEGGVRVEEMEQEEEERVVVEVEEEVGGRGVKEVKVGRDS